MNVTKFSAREVSLKWTPSVEIRTSQPHPSERWVTGTTVFLSTPLGSVSGLRGGSRDRRVRGASLPLGPVFTTSPLSLVYGWYSFPGPGPPRRHGLGRGSKGGSEQPRLHP